MAWQVTSLTLPLVLSGLLSISVAYLAWQDRPRSGAAVISAILGAISLWGFGQAVLVSAGSLALKESGFAVSTVGFLSIPPLWLRYSLAYTGRHEDVPESVLTGLTGFPLLIAAVVFTNGVHGLIYVDAAVQGTGADAVFVYEWGQLYLALMVASYAAILAAEWLLFWQVVHSRNVYRRRAFLFLFFGLTLTSCHFLSQFGVSPFPYYTLGPLYSLFIALLSILAFLSYRSLAFLPINRLLGMFGTRSAHLSPLARETIIEELGNGVVVMDHENRIVDINPRGKRMFGGRDSRIVGQRLRDVVPPDVFTTDETAILDPDAAEGAYRSLWIDVPDGGQRCFDVTLTDLENADGSKAGRVALVHDVTDREHRKQKLEERTDELERQNDQLENVASMISHDLRSPLNVASGAVDLAEENGDPGYFDKARRAHQRMEQIIDDVLTLARQGQTVSDTESVTLEQLARESWSHVETRDATLETEVDVRVAADRNRLYQVFENFFRNALEHGRPDATVRVGTLELTDGTAGDERDRVHGFYVEDDGPGIPEERREDVLTEGFSTSSDGTGFGLSIVTTIVEAHGWEITVTDGTDGGARFEITGITTVPTDSAEAEQLS